MNETGASGWLAAQLLASMGKLGLGSGLPLVAVVVLITTAVSNAMSPGPAVAILGPVFLDVARLSHTSLLVVGFATALASAFGYLTVVGSPARTIIYGSGYLRTRDYWRAGWKMTLVSVGIVLVMAELYWPWLEGN
jgi:sodium-dependent dicarboxylate transporter 2/3/5